MLRLDFKRGGVPSTHNLFACCGKGTGLIFKVKGYFNFLFSGQSLPRFRVSPKAFTSAACGDPHILINLSAIHHRKK
jgi:hypothetical protein